MNKGILILATGHPYYGRYAFNLAATIKAIEPDFPVAIIHEGRALSHLSERQLRVFDHIIDLPDDIPHGFSAKLFMYDLSPFEETLYLDADMLWLTGKNPSDLFSELASVEYTGITEGWYDIQTASYANVNQVYYFWAEPGDIVTVYKLSTGRIYQWRSEVVYFKKTEKVEKFFKDAQAINEDPKVTLQKKFGGEIPDELGINISSAINGIAPHKDKWTPAYWHKLHRDIIPDLATLSTHWYLISFGSNHSSTSAKRVYDQICKLALKKLGMSHVFGLHSKKEFLASRLKM